MCKKVETGLISIVVDDDDDVDADADDVDDDDDDDVDADADASSSRYKPTRRLGLSLFMCSQSEK